MELDCMCAWVLQRPKVCGANLLLKWVTFIIGTTTDCRTTCRINTCRIDAANPIQLHWGAVESILGCPDCLAWRPCHYSLIVFACQGKVGGQIIICVLQHLKADIVHVLSIMNITLEQSIGIHRDFFISNFCFHRINLTNVCILPSNITKDLFC